MPLDTSQIVWDDDAIDPASVQWDDQPAPGSSGPSRRYSAMREDPKPVGNIFSAADDVLKTMASGAVAAPVSGLAGLATAAGNFVGLTDKNPTDVIESVGQRFTYEPRTQAGEVGVQAASWPWQKIAQGADYVGGAVAEETGSPLLGAAANTGIQFGAGVLGAKGLAKAAGVPAKVKTKPLAPRQGSVQGAQELGLALTPQQAEGGAVARSVAAISNRAQLERELSLKNAGKVNAAVQQDVGLPPSPTLDRTALAQARQAANQPYKDAAALPRGKFDATFKAKIASIDDRSGAGTFVDDTPAAVANLKKIYSSYDEFSSADVVAKIRQLRNDGFKNQHPMRTPEEQAKGHAQIRVADALDDMLERHAAANGRPDLGTALKDARKQLAKLHSIRRAIKGNDISARELNRQAGRNVPLEGNMRKVADAFENFDRSLQDVGKVRDFGPVGLADVLIGAGGAAFQPALLAATAARPLARNFLASGIYQRQLAPQLYRTNALIPAAEAGLLAPLPQQSMQTR